MIVHAGFSCDATLDEDAGTLTLVHSGLAAKKHKRDASPRVIPLGAIESVEFAKSTMVKRGFVRFLLRGRSGYHQDVIEDVNGYLLKGTRDKLAEPFVEAVQRALFGVPPVDGYGAAGTAEETRPGMLERTQSRETQTFAEMLEDVQTQSFGAFRIKENELKHYWRSFPIEGATATVESAGIARSRITATRVIGGGAMLGGVGAIIGALARKDKSSIFLTVELADGTVIVEECPVSRERAARRFAARLSTAGRTQGATPTVAAPVPVPPRPETIAQPKPTSPTVQGPPAGWYPDPQGGPAPRWWNGVDWTDQVKPTDER
ncbi:DUF2510 domain-containing protein [Nocardia salmonicida]|uniref:DUF2510 domain-containing protein n=1 Tax=Nocardia salmonicida TaxID=53431 RepID=UPI002E2D6DD7|nr:DUF2510 domain-containing protein [Nocardia salmonicida]